MADINQRVKMGFSEIRTQVLGAQIPLGFQYEALFQPRFERLPAHGKASEGCAYLLLLASVVMLLSPVSFHRLSERGEMTPTLDRVGVAFVLSALAPLALGLGGDAFVVLAKVTGRAPLAGAIAAVSAMAALLVWFAWPLAARSPRRGGPARPVAAE